MTVYLCGFGWLARAACLRTAVVIRFERAASTAPASASTGGGSWTTSAASSAIRVQREGEDGALVRGSVRQITIGGIAPSHGIRGCWKSCKSNSNRLGSRRLSKPAAAA